MMSFSIVFWSMGISFVGTWVYLAVRDYGERERKR